MVVISLYLVISLMYLHKALISMFVFSPRHAVFAVKPFWVKSGGALPLLPSFQQLRLALVGALGFCRSNYNYNNSH